jgi:hypothetical protein
MPTRSLSVRWLPAVLVALGCSSDPPAPVDAAACKGAQCDAGADAADAEPADAPRFDVPDGSRDDVASIDAAVSDATDGSAPEASVDAVSDAPPPPCPLYQSRCAGVCIPTSVDPMNCGGCGVRCAPGRLCAAGGCVEACPAGLTACAGTCVDAASDSAHCGVCGTACAAGTGCVAGRCERAVGVDPSGAACAGGGPPVELGGGRCAGAVAETSFRWAICSCTNLRMTTPLRTDGFDSTAGPYAPGGTGAGVGANGAFSNTNTTDVGGPLWIGASTDWGISSPQRVRQFLRVNSGIIPANSLDVAEDAYVRGDIRASVPVNIAGALHVPEGATVTDNVISRRTLREPVTVTPPCDCDASSFVPVVEYANAARSRNDNARIGLDLDALVAPTTARRLDLPCGRYFLSRIGGSGPITIVAHGRTALFVAGDVDVNAALTVTLDPGAELDIVIGGRLRATSALTIGSPNYPALTRVYVGSPDGFDVTNVTALGGNFYVPGGRFRTTATLEVYGAIFAGDFISTSTVAVHYDRAVLRAGDVCRNPPPVAAGDAGVADAGAPDAGGFPMCMSCRDCANQACVGGRCGACRSDNDCCAPLQCWMGRCVIVPG